MPMSSGKKVFLLVWGLLETWVFSGNILGWAALNYMLKGQGIYHHLCVSDGAVTANSTFYDTLPTDSPLPTQNADAVLQKLLDATTTEAATIAATKPSILNRHRHGPGCVAQEKMLNLAYTIGIFCVGFSAFIWGFLLDKLGLRIIRLLLNGFITVGAVLFSVTTKDTPYLIFPALTLMCLAGVPLRLANMQIANLFPSRRSTVITLYSGAFTASASIFIFTKYAYDAGLSWEMVCYVLVAGSATMLPVTLFCLPAEKIEDDSVKSAEKVTVESPKPLFKGTSDIAAITTLSTGKFSMLPASPFNYRKPSDMVSNYPMANKVSPYNYSKTLDVVSDCSPTTKEWIRQPPAVVPPDSQNQGKPFMRSLLSVSFNLHQYWFSWLLLATLNYAGSVHLWLKRIAGDEGTAGKYTEVYGLCQVTSLLLAPMAGLLMDNILSSSEKETDPEKRKLVRLRSGFWPMLLTTSFQAAVQICKFFENETAVYMSIGFTTLLRSFHVAVATAYLRIRFPGDHFNRLLGIMSTVSSIASLLQFPLFIWESASKESVFDVNVFNCVTLMVAFIHPLHLLITPLQRYFIRKEREETEPRPEEGVA